MKIAFDAVSDGISHHHRSTQQEQRQRRGRRSKSERQTLYLYLLLCLSDLCSLISGLLFSYSKEGYNTIARKTGERDTCCVVSGVKKKDKK